MSCWAHGEQTTALMPSLIPMATAWSWLPYFGCFAWCLTVHTYTHTWLQVIITCMVDRRHKHVIILITLVFILARVRRTPLLFNPSVENNNLLFSPSSHQQMFYSFLHNLLFLSFWWKLMLSSWIWYSWLNPSFRNLFFLRSLIRLYIIHSARKYFCHTLS